MPPSSLIIFICVQTSREILSVSRGPERRDEMVQFEAWHGKTLAEHEALRNQWAAQGYRFVSLSIYGAVNAPVFAAVMVKQAEPVAQRDFPVMTAAQWQLTFDTQALQGYGPIILAATGTAADPRFAAVFELQQLRLLPPGPRRCQAARHR